MTWPRWISWAWAGVLLLIYWKLGVVASVVASLYEGMEDDMPTATVLAMRYGPSAFPFFGAIAAGALIVADSFSLRWVQWCVFVAAVGLIVYIFSALTSVHGGLGPTNRTARPAATIRFQFPTLSLYVC